MKVVILAAGTGTRLLPLTQEVPKCLLMVNGRSVLQRIIETCQSRSVNDFLVVAGHKKENLLKALEGLHGASPARYECVENPDYRTTNTGVSLYLALQRQTDDLIVINGDNVFDERIIRDLLDSPRTSIVIDDTKTLTEESFKVGIKGQVIELMGKDIPIDRANGEFIGISLIRREDLDSVRRLLGELIDRNRKEYYDFAFQQLSRVGPVGFVYTHGLKWTEIDTLDDLHTAESLARDLDRLSARNAPTAD